jgi:o-succinylbenzoate synthase
VPNYPELVRSICKDVEAAQTVDYERLRNYPSVLFGIETALLHLKHRTTAFFDTPFSRGEQGIRINGLIWMGTYDEMFARINEKLKAGFKCVKLKIGAIDFERELALIAYIRQHFSADVLELRVDANGAFSLDDVEQKLAQLAKYQIHSIEQPIKAGQWQAMGNLCRNTPIPIALDEELIGVNAIERKTALLDTIRPQYIILKPSLHGAMRGSDEWISMAEARGIGWWATSALESNVGLNAIAQWVATHNITLPQGLGTGLLFSTNVPMPLKIVGDKLYYGVAQNAE